MNVFKRLDAIFPCAPNRVSGEVVSISIEVYHNHCYIGNIEMKRKAWYVNASVNAFHVHRHLIREYLNLDVRDISGTNRKIAKQLIGLAVLTGYLVNAKADTQYFGFHLHTSSAQGVKPWMFWTVSGDDFREVRSIKGLGLEAQVDLAVVQYLLREPKKQSPRVTPWELLPSDSSIEE